MSTAHKPTWKPAIGMSQAKGYVPTRSYSARDMPGYLDLKSRKPGQGTIEELKNRDFKAQLLKRQAELNNKKLRNEQEQKMVTQNSEVPDFVINNPSKKIRKPGQKAQAEEQQAVQQDNPFPQDQDSQSFVRSDNQKNLSDSDEDDDQQLLRQFQRVKQQRQLQERQKMQEKAKYSANNKQSQLLKGNPLLQGGFSLTKRWYEDTVFKNQAKRVDEKKSYVNDNIRSEFHRKFINKYVMR